MRDGGRTRASLRRALLTTMHEHVYVRAVTGSYAVVVVEGAMVADPGASLEELIQPEDRTAYRLAVAEAASLGLGEHLDVTYRAFDGERWRTVHDRLTPFALDGLADPHVLGVAREVVGPDETQDALRRVELRFRRLVEGLPLGLATIDAEGRITYANETLAELTGRTAIELCAGTLASLLASDAGMWHDDQRPRLLAGEIDAVRGEHSLAGSGGWVRQTLVRFPLDDGAPGALAVFEDVTARRAAELAAERARDTDELTGLASRSALERQLAGGLPDAVVVVALDLDDFRKVNDSFGHAAGDEVLRVIARRLRRDIGVDDLLARTGGDTFLVGFSRAEAADALGAAQAVLSVVRRPVKVAGHEIVVTASAGVGVLAPTDDVRDVLRDTDAALHRAKSRGPNTVVVADASLAEAALRQVRLESELRRALASAELRLHYQPVVDRSGVLSGAEALVRWEHPRLGLLPPAEFLDVAASSDLIVHLGSWVLQETCAELARWARPGTGPVPVHVSCNVVARQLGDAFTGQIASLLDRFDLPPSALSIEITEDELVDATAIARGVLSDLQRDGVGVAVDDFGTGYAPLSHMRDLPATTVKIDRSFVAGLGHDPADTAIVRAVIDLAHALGKEVVAEGVETQQQWELLRQYGCDRAQGFLFSRPLPAEAFPGLRLAG